MEDDIGGNQRRRAGQIYGEDDQTANRRRQAIGTANDEQLPLSLSVGPSSNSSLISPSPVAPPPPMTTSPSPVAPRPPMTTSPSLVAPPPPMTTWPSSDFIPRMASSSSCFTTSPPYLTSSFPSNSLQQIGSQRPTVNVFPPSTSGFASSSNQTQSPPLASAVVQRRASSGSKSAVNQISDTIPPPFPWATNKKGKIHSLEHLESKQITTITGDVQCKYCEKVYQVKYNLREKFSEVASIFVMRKEVMRDRAPPMWNNPEPARCELCGGEKAVKPVIAKRKSEINWLFLLLGQTLGYCKLDQLRNFCKHSKIHRTGAKDRVLYLTYMALCKMLQPNREFFNHETLRR